MNNDLNYDSKPFLVWSQKGQVKDRKRCNNAILHAENVKQWLESRLKLITG